MVPTSPDSEKFAWLSPPLVVAVVVLLAATKLYLSAHAGLAFDEGYYTFWSERLQVGYLDHPPAVAWMIAAGRALLGNNELGVRLLAVASGVGVSAALWRTGMLLLGRPVAALAVLLYNLTPSAGLGFITTPDPPSVLCWAAAVWAIAEFIASRRATWWLVAGLFAGLGLWSKYTDAFLAPGLLLFILTDRERRGWLKLWQVWAAAVLALAVFSPVIWWNAQYGWASFLFQGQRTVVPGQGTSFLENLGDLLAGQAAYMAPILFIFALAGVVTFFVRWRDAGWQQLALPVWTSVPALAYFLYHTLHARVEANWLIPLWPSLALVGAAAAMRLWRARPRLTGWLIGAQVVIGLTMTLLIYAQALWQPFDIGGLDRTNETRGWPKLVGDLDKLAAANSARWIATSANFGITGELASYTLFAGSPVPVRQIDEPMRWLFVPPPAPDALGWPALYLGAGANATPPTDLFGSTKLIGTVTRDGGRWPLESYSVFLVDQPTAKFAGGLKP